MNRNNNKILFHEAYGNFFRLRLNFLDMYLFWNTNIKIDA